MTRRELLRAIVSFGGLALLSDLRCYGADLDAVIGTIVDRARFYLKTTNWAPRRSFGPFKEAYYCNVFVADVLREAGAATWDPISRPIGILPDRDPVAREWEDPTFSIKGWTVIFHAGTSFGQNSAQQMLAKRNPGDVVSGTGHVGIVSDEKRTLSASSITGAVEHTSWSFLLPDTNGFSSPADWETAAKNNVRKFTVRRFVGI